MKKYKPSQTIVSERFASLFSFPVIVIGLIVLIGWFNGLMFLTRFSINEVPMAPSTAYVFIFIAIGLWFYLRPQNIAINRNTAIISTIMAICISSLFVITNILNYYPDWEHLFITIPETQLSMKLGHMSLVTGILFIISGFALFLLQSKQNIMKTISIILTLIIFIISFILLLGYGFAAPFFYFDSFIPPAVLTVLSFLLISLALITASDRNTFLLKTIWNTSTSSKLLRIFLPTTIAITVIESLIVIRILPLLNIHPAIGVSVVSLIFVLAVIIVISIISKSMGKALDSALAHLSESEAKFRVVFENSLIGKSMTELDGFLKVNKAFCKIVGYTPEELRAKTWMEITHPDEIQHIKELTQSLLDGTIPQAQFEKRYIHKNGNIVYTDVSTYLQRDANGDPQFFITSVSDITERKLVEEKLRKSNEFSKEIIEAMSDGFSILDEGGVHIDVNLAFCKMTGFSKEELIGVGPPHPYWPEEEFDNIQAAFVKTAQGNFENFELVFKNKNGKRFPVLVNPSQIKDEQGNVVSNFATVVDITERKKTQEALKSNEFKFRTLADYTSDWEYWEEDNKQIIYMSPSCEKITGYTQEEFISDPTILVKIVHPDDVSLMIEHNHKVKQNKNRNTWNWIWSNSRKAIQSVSRC